MGNSSDVQGQQQHPISLYFKVWGLLFVLSGLSYAVDYMQVQGELRWTLIIIFMFLKAGLIVAVFMHMVWERMAFVLAILLIALMSIEADYTYFNRLFFFND